MLRKLGTVILSSFLIGTAVSCTSGNAKEPSIRGRTDTAYEKTMEELALGYAFDYTLEIPDDFKGRVSLWSEIYDEGVKMEDGGMSFGWEPELMGSSDVGFVLLNIDGEPRPMHYASGGAMRGNPGSLATKYRFSAGGATWVDLAEEEAITLTYDVPQVVAVYQADLSGEIRTVDYLDPAQLEEMIQENDFVVLFKVELSSEPLGNPGP